MSERTAQVLYWAALASLLTAICPGTSQNEPYVARLRRARPTPERDGRSG
ncbi:hypothetical protein ACIQRW_09760 [Streptomyces sp. NPDC091287]